MISVLYVDDEPGLLEIFKLFLEMDGQFSVDTIPSAPAALTLLNSKIYDAIVSDYQMPEMDGIEFLKQVRASGNTIPFIIFTGRGREQVVIQALNEGADFYLQKGGEPQAQFAELTNKIRYAVNRRKTEKEVSEAGERYKALIAVSNTGAWEYHHDTGYLWCSPEYFSMLGRDATQFDLSGTENLKETWIDLIHPEDQETASRNFKDFIVNSSEGLYDDHFRMKHADGHYVWIWSRGWTLRDKNGVLTKKTIGTHIDVTERKTAEEVLRERETQLRATLESTADGILAVDNNGKVLQASRRFAELWRIPPSLMKRGDNRALLDFMLDQLTDPDAFLRKVQALYRSDAVEIDTLAFKDGRVFERYSSPMIMDGARIGRVWSFRYITERKRVEKALRENEERYRAVVESQTEFISRFLPDGTHIFANEAYCRYFGKNPDEIIGTRFIPAIPKEDKKLLEQHFASLTPMKPVAIVEHRIIMPDSGIRWQAWSDRAIFNADGQVAEYQSVGRDITKRKEAERALLESETRLHAVVHGSPIPKFVIDKNHCIIYWNKALEEHSGIRASEIIGTNQQWRAFYPVERPCMADLLVDGAIDKIPQWYEGKYSSSKFIEGAFEATDFFPKLGKTGTWLYFTAAPIRDKEGNIIGAVETLEDITDRKRSEEALRESEQRYRNVVEDQTEFISRFLPDGTHVFVNEAYCRYFGLKRDGILGHRFRPKIPAEDQERVSRFFTSLTPDHPVDTVEHRIIMPDGEVRWQRWSDRAIFNSSRTVTEYQSVGRDITEYKQAEEALASAYKKLKLLSRITRHDINNQLTILMGYLGHLEKTQPDTSFGEYFKKINTSAERISSMIRFTKEYEEIGVNAPVWQNCRKLVDTAARQISPGDVVVKNDLFAGTEVFADPLIVKVFYNLMDNAVRCGGKITTIRFSSQESEENPVIICEDDGDGVPAHEKEKIFERGFGRNTGLGLFLAREILGITGITIRETGKQGEGARFEMEVPPGAYRFTGAIAPLSGVGK
jgi:PAS domain S-box-containing protein